MLAQIAPVSVIGAFGLIFYRDAADQARTKEREIQESMTRKIEDGTIGAKGYARAATSLVWAWLLRWLPAVLLVFTFGVATTEIVVYAERGMSAASAHDFIRVQVGFFLASWIAVCYLVMRTNVPYPDPVRKSSEGEGTG